MKIITKAQAILLHGYSGDNDGFRLRNGDVAYCKETRTIVTCCHNCGGYSHAKVPKTVTTSGSANSTVYGEIQEGAKANARLIAAAPALLEACEGDPDNFKPEQLILVNTTRG